MTEDIISQKERVKLLRLGPNLYCVIEGSLIGVQFFKQEKAEKYYNRIVKNLPSEQLQKKKRKSTRRQKTP